MGWCAKGVEAKQNSPTLMRIMSLMEHEGSAKVQVIESWRLNLSLIISELVIWGTVSTVAEKGTLSLRIHG